MRIAICDDIRTHAEELARLVAQYYGEDAELCIFENGKSLISMITDKSNPSFDLIFLDVLMPKHNGMTVAKQSDV